MASRTPPNTRRGSKTDSQNQGLMSEMKKLLEENKREIVSCFQTQFDQMNATITTLSSHISDIVGSIAQLSSDVLNLQSRVKVIENEVNKHMLNSETIFNAVVTECNQIQMRRKNVIVSGLQEKSHGTIQERIDHDIEKCEELLSALDIHDCDIQRTIRIGRPRPDGVRLLKIEFSKESVKRSVIRNAKSLRNSKDANYRNVFINPDETYLQRIQSKRLRDEIKTRKQKGEDVVIRNGKVVPRNSLSKSQDFRIEF